MREVVRVRDAISPHIVVMACDAMTGQDAIVQARAFRAAVDVDGFVLTKMDGDARGGAAVSIAAATGRPVYFIGMGERPDALEPFHPDRMASRILGMGDVLGLIDRAQDSIDREKAAEQAERLATARFTLEDFLDQLRQMRRLGPLQDVLAMLPGAAASGVQVDEGRLVKAEAVICSMTPEERRNPAIIGGSRRARIAKGSGTTTADVNSLLREFDQARKMMKTVLGGGGLLDGDDRGPALGGAEPLLAVVAGGDEVPVAAGVLARELGPGVGPALPGLGPGGAGAHAFKEAMTPFGMRIDVLDGAAVGSARAGASAAPTCATISRSRCPRRLQARPSRCVCRSTR